MIFKLIQAVSDKLKLLDDAQNRSISSRMHTTVIYHVCTKNVGLSSPPF